MISKQKIKDLHNQFKVLENDIKEYDQIIIYRHQSPDFDAMGSQMGLYLFIKENYPDKKVYYVGDNHPDHMPELFPYTEELDESVYDIPHLAITVDVSNRSRIACDHIDKASKIDKIDHHPLPATVEEMYGHFLIVHPDIPAASEIVALFALSRGKKYKISKECASYLYCGIVGDTGKFSYQDTDGTTLRVAADLLDCGVDCNKINDLMYQTSAKRLNILKYCLNTYKLTDSGICYYVFTKEIMKQLAMTVDHGNLHINTFRNMKGVKVACSCTWDEGHQNYRIFLRSANTVIAGACVKYGGGGHDYASGCHIDSLDVLPEFIKTIEEYIREK